MTSSICFENSAGGNSRVVQQRSAPDRGSRCSLPPVTAGVRLHQIRSDLSLYLLRGTTSEAELVEKRLELLQEAFPHITRVGHLSDKNVVTHLQEVEAAARLVGVRIQPLEVHGPEELEQAFRAPRAERAEALIVVHHGFLISRRERIAQLVDTIRLPVMYTDSDFVKSGGLMSYGEDRLDRARRAATLVDKIFKGTKPADLPVERPTKFVLAINLKTAQTLGITIPPIILFQADEVIQ
jgi:putative tryptophan/tyrosine transport system substrate-binding protein